MERIGDREALQDALRIVSRRIPEAVAASFETSDQGYVGFGLTSVEITAGRDLVYIDMATLLSLAEEIWPLTSGIGWDGVMREDKYGRARIGIVSDDVV